MEVKTNNKDILIKELSKKNVELYSKNISLLDELNEIYSSRWYKINYLFRHPMLLIEKSIFRIFPHWLIPRPIKERLKQLINFEKTKEKDFLFRVNTILKTERGYKGDIIIYSVIAWGFRFQRPQQLATEFQKNGYRVWYIKNDFIISSAFTPNRYPKIFKITKGIYEITLPSRSPLFIYTDTLNERNASLMKKSMDILIKSVKMINIIQIVQYPFWSNLTFKLPYPVIYDCMDDHQSFEVGSKNDENEINLTKKADVIVATSNYLKNKMSQYSNKVKVIKNACDYNHFSNLDVPISRLVSNVKHPVIGYYGALAEWFDKDLIIKAVEKNPKWNFILVGRTTDELLLELKKYKQIKFLGEQPYSDLPGIIKAIDVCIIPFKLTSLIKATDPVKFYEMLAAGKPIVATKIPEIAHFNEPILYLVDNKDDFSDQIKKALKEDSKINQEKRQQLAIQNTWDKRSIDFLNIIDNIYPKVSIVLVTYNNWDLTKKCLASLDKDGYPNKEIIIVDNNSTDETRTNLIELQNQKKIIAVLNSENFGFAKGNNIGIRMATGEYICLLNNDTEVSPQWIQKMIRHLNNDKTIGIVGPVTNQSGNETRIFIRGSKERIIRVGREYAEKHDGQIFDIEMLPAHCWFLRTNVMRQVGFLDEKYGKGMFEDDDYCLRMKKLGKRLVCAEDVFLYHKGKASFNEIDDEAYITLFETNKIRFEKKWKIKWTPHQRRKIKFL